MKRSRLRSTAIVAAIGAILSAVFYWFVHPPAIPSFAEVRSTYRKSEGVLYDRNGEVIHEMRVDTKNRRLDWIRPESVSPAVTACVVASEDRRFFEHRGVDWRAVAAASFGSLQNSGPRGASTITMQLAALIAPDLKPVSGRRSFRQKIRQGLAALEMEDKWSKKEILEAYLNLVDFRGELRGINAAARGIFGRHPGALDKGEALILTAMIPSPNAPSGRIIARAGTIASTLGWTDAADTLRQYADNPLKPGPILPETALAPHVAERLINSRKQSASCLLDGRIQSNVTETTKNVMIGLTERNARDAAVLVVENTTGDILAYVGNTGKLSSARYIDGVRAGRQAGSTLKPLLYALAIDRKILTAATPLDDTPFDHPTETGIYTPKNYDRNYKGEVSVRTALASSLNIPATRTLNMVGETEFVTLLNSLGFALKDVGEERFGLSLALGSVDVTLLELTNAYRTLAIGGGLSRLRLKPDDPAPSPVQVISREAAFIVTDILADREARSLTFGFENPLSTSFFSAVKTGTSKDMRDNWCVGYSRHFTVGVWVGNFSGEPMKNVSGISGAAVIWREVMNFLHEGMSSEPPEPPAGVVGSKVFDTGGAEGGREEWFISGTEPTKHPNLGGAGVSAHLRPKIAYPPAGAILAIDPDIPRENLRVFFKVSNIKPELTWELNGKYLEKAEGITPWDPEPGNYTLSLRDKRGNLLDTVNFRVRN